MTTLLSSMVFCSTSYRCRTFKGFGNLPPEAQIALKSVTKGQRHKFKKFGVVPMPVLVALWHQGLFPCEDVPKKGMEIFKLTKHLREYKYRTKQAADRGNWLYHQIMKEEVIDRRPVVRKEKMPAMKIKHDSRPGTLVSRR